MQTLIIEVRTAVFDKMLKTLLSEYA